MHTHNKTIGQAERNSDVTKRLYSENLRFLDGKCLRNVDVSLTERRTAKKVRRIVEKRTCQHFFRQNKRSFRCSGNRSRHLMGRAISYELYTLGIVEDSLKRDKSSHWKKEYDPLLNQVVLKKKVGYKTFDEAHRIAVSWNFEHINDPNPVFPYFCPHCKKYHIGHTYIPVNSNIGERNAI